jgi:DNA polymerase III subunit delta'
MTEPTTALGLLSSKLCPWLAEPYARCVGALEGERLGHAWLIHGVAGIGKVNLAFALAERLLGGTTHALPPMAPSELVRAMTGRREAQNHHPDLQCVYPEEDKATIGVEQIRLVIEGLALKSFAGSAKVVVIEPAEAMTVAAANALLKTLEQPSPQSYLLLVSHCPGRLPATIRSRCQRIAIRPPGSDDARAWAALEGAAALARIGPPEAFRAPLDFAAALAADGPDAHPSYARDLEQLRRGTADPIAVADAWSKRDLDHALGWLIEHLHSSIREQSLAGGSTPITETGPRGLHTAADGRSLRSHFERLDQAEELRNQLGGGINAQLALRVLLLGFRPEREAT